MRATRLPAAILLGASALVLPGSAGAHEFWIEPQTFTPAPSQALRIGLRVGERLLGEPVRRETVKIRRFELVSESGASQVVGRDGGSQSFARAAGPGAHVIVYQSNPQPISFAPADFAKYAREEGLSHIVAQSTAPAEAGVVREVYTRCAKSIVPFGDGPGADRRVGLPLEIIAERPATPGAATRGFRVVFESAPLADATVVACRRGEPTRLLRAQTDSNGAVTLPISQGDDWIVTTIHMTRAAPELTAAWHSYWASLTFQVPAAVDSAD
jgi:uncharacterized GH25 family protein